MKSLTLAAMLLFAALPLAADVRGTAVNIDGHPVAGARADLFDAESEREALLRVIAGKTRQLVASAAADAKGSFTVPLSKKGNYVLAVSAEGFAPAFVVTTGAEDLAGVLLKRAALRSGRVTADGKGVAGAVVLLRAQTTLEFRTDDEGRFSVPDPKVWKPSLAIVAPGFALHRQASGGAYGEALRLDVRLTAGTTLRGRVVAPDGKSGTKAKLFLDGLSAGESAEDGLFAIEHVGPSWEEIRAVGGELVARGERKTYGTLRLAKATRLAGTVVDAKSRVPISGAVVAIRSENSTNSFDAVRTDAAGRYAFAVLPGTYAITLSYAGYNTIAGNRLVTAASPARTTYLKRDARVTGVVADEQRSPLAGARVQAAYHDPTRGRASDNASVTAPDGRYALRIPADMFENGDLVIEASKSGWALAKEGPHTVKEDDEKRVNLTLTRGVALTGRVTDAAGAPLAGVAVGTQEMPRQNMSMSYRVDWSELPVTDRDGLFRIPLRPATYTVRFYVPGFAPRMLRDVKVDDAAQPLDVKLDPAVSISGRVVTAGGEPAANLAIQVFLPGPELITRTDDTGAFTMGGLPAELVTVYFSNDDESISEERSIKAPATDVLVKLTPTISISGRVVGKGGAPVRDFSVRTAVPEQAGMYWGGDGRSGEFHDSSGKFVLDGVAVRPAELQVKAPGYQRARIPLKLESGKDVEGLEITLERAATLRGRVTGANGAPVERAFVAMRTAASAREAAGSAATDADGEYVIEEAPTGETTVSVTKRGYQSFKKILTIDTADARLDVQLDPGKIVQGRVVTDSGQPVADVQIQAFSPSGGNNFSGATSDAAGRFQLEGLAPAIYSVRAMKRGYPTFEKGDFDTATATELTITLTSGATITGTITGLPPEAMKNVTARAFSGPTMAQANVDASGAFKIEGAPVGTVTVNASLRGQSMRSSDPVTLETQASGTYKADLEFKAHNTVSGRITRRGTPLATGSVYFFSAGAGTGGGGSIDGTGKYEVQGLPSADYRVQIMDSNTNSRYLVNRTVSRSQTLDIDINPATLSGTVVDEATGNPVNGAEVVLEPTESPEEYGFMKPEARTGGDGRVVLENIPPGQYQLRVSKEGYASHLEAKSASDGATIGIDVRLRPSQGVTLRIIDGRTGKPTSGWLIARRQDGVVAWSGQTNVKPDGTTVVPLPPGSYRVNVISFGDGLASTYANVTAPGTQEVVMPRAGTLEFAGDGTRLRVRFVNASGAEYNVAPITAATITAYAGQRIPTFAAGSYTMQVIDANGNVTKSYRFDIREGQVTKLNL